MSFGQAITQTYRDLRQSWMRLADSAYGKSLSPRDEMARGEFISAFISERELSFPAAGKDPRQR